MKNRILPGRLFVLLMLLSGSSYLQSSSLDHPKEFELYGYLSNYIGVTFRGKEAETNGADIGYVLYMRLKGDWWPHQSLAVHFEAAYTGSLGNQNSWALYDYYGLLPFDPDDFPTFDYVQSFELDHIWARWTGNTFDLTFGKVPIAWGTGYVFNPSSRASTSAFLDFVREETPGTFALVPAVSPVWWLSLDGYLAFQEKTHSKSTKLIEGSWRDIPFGLRAKFLAGPADLSLGIVREVADYEGNGSTDDGWYTTGDGVTTFGPVGIYSESALLLPVGSDAEDWDIWNALDSVLGFEWFLPGIPVSLRMEYYHQGAGVTDKGSYNISEVLTGRQILLAEDYLFCGLEWNFLNYGRLSTSTLINLNDGSYLISPQIAWDIHADFAIELGALTFFGEGDDEFGGLVVTPSGVIDLMDPNLYLRLKVSF
jgi:hypothetical protein